jgi:hypothetical protein
MDKLTKIHAKKNNTDYEIELNFGKRKSILTRRQIELIIDAVEAMGASRSPDYQVIFEVK